MKLGRILIVENDPLWQEFLQDPLQDEYLLTVVSNRAEAEKALREAKLSGTPYDVVTVDIGLEQDNVALDGEHILALVNKYHRKTKCIVVSGHHDVSTTRLRNYFKKFDVYDYVGKADFDLIQYKQIIDSAFLFHGYRLLQEVGRGGMGIVYKALDPHHDNRTVALKVLHPMSGLSPEEIVRRMARFVQEIEASRRLEHPNIVKMFDYVALEELDGQAFFIMEFLDGSTLENVLKQKQMLSLPQILHIIAQLCDALTYAHQRQVVHRDIKPSNIMLLAEDRVKITDFGIAKVLDAGASLTKTEEIVGTLDYMPPEQILHTKEIDHRVDIYAVGVILYELLSQTSPYPDPMHKLMNDPPPLHQVNPQVSSKLSEIVMRSLARDPNERFQNISQFADALYTLT